MLRVTVSCDGRRADLLVAGGVPIAELVPELARQVGVLDRALAPAGLGLFTLDGRELAASSTLGDADIVDGGRLVLSSRPDPPPPRRYDDPAEVVADLVGREVRPRSATGGRRTPSRAAALPVAVAVALAGAVVAVCGLASTLWHLDPAVVATAALVLVVQAGSAFPSIALGIAGCSDPDIRGPAPDLDVRRAHDIWLLLSSASGLSLVAAAPLAVSLGIWGALAATVACLVVVLRVRRPHSGDVVLVGLAGGALGLAAVALSALLLHPSWRPWVAGLVVAGAVVAFASTRWSPVGAVRLAWLGDLAETTALVALLPLLVAACGLLDPASLRGW